MRLLVATDNRFVRTRDGNIYSKTVCDHFFWRRYLEVFDEVVVLARVKDIGDDTLAKEPATGPRVNFLPLPTFIGPWQYLRHYLQLKTLVKQAVGEADAFLLRVPGTVASLLWHYLRRRKIPYAVEVVGDPAGCLSVANTRSILAPVARYIFANHLKKQCRYAAATSYVTERYLQSKYPPVGWSISGSDIDLPEDAIIDDDGLQQRFRQLEDAVRGKRPFRICHIGSMSALYKAQDTLIEALAICRKQKFNVELTLLGDGRYQYVFVEEARRLGVSDHVRFVGRVPPGKPVMEQLDAADLFVLPSLTEGLPRALVEAMARGLPCIGTRVGGIPELLSNEDLIAPGDAKELGKRIMAVMANLEKLRQMADRNLRKANEYRKDELGDRRQALYRKLAEITIGARMRRG
ncbi:MAG TPA: glycosyltransferase [Sedimentisphaerales bacterium]|nr:glycosyltransferase [Sedimentisphaerales bacterium]